MPCQITIDEPSLYAEATTNGLITEIHVAGTANCQTVIVKSNCNKPSETSAAVINGKWEAILNVPIGRCACDDDRIQISAVCMDDPDCIPVYYEGSIPCRSRKCPTIGIQVYKDGIDVTDQVINQACVEAGSYTFIVLVDPPSSANIDLDIEVNSIDIDLSTDPRVTNLSPDNSQFTFELSANINLVVIAAIYTPGDCGIESTSIELTGCDHGCPPNTDYNSITGECCPEGQRYNPVTETCEERIPECPPNTDYNPIAGECCPEGQRYNPVTRKCEERISECPPNTDYNPITGECCPEGQRYNPVARKCEERVQNGGSKPKCGGLVWAAVIILVIGLVLLAIAGCTGYTPLAVTGGILIALYGLLMALVWVLDFFGICKTDICEAANIHLTVLGPVAVIAAIIVYFLPCINVYLAVTILGGILGLWASIGAGCLLTKRR